MGLCLDLDATGLVCQTREDETEKIAWLRRQGFQQAMRYPRSTLNVAEFDPVTYSDLSAKIAAQGLEIISLAELHVRDPEWQRNTYDLEMLLNQDVPRPTGFTPPPFEKYAQTEFAGPEFMPELWLIALDGDAYVGMSSLWKSGDGIEMLETGLTGVHRDYRRRGLAKVLKCQAIEIAQGLGATLIQTWNEENNPMFQLNLQLGFEAQPADVDWEKLLDIGR
jgi:GNAT superfamily N-acetyltransferase